MTDREQEKEKAESDIEADSAVAGSREESTAKATEATSAGRAATTISTPVRAARKPAANRVRATPACEPGRRSCVAATGAADIAGFVAAGRAQHVADRAPRYVCGPSGVHRRVDGPLCDRTGRGIRSVGHGPCHLDRVLEFAQRPSLSIDVYTPNTPHVVPLCTHVESRHGVRVCRHRSMYSNHFGS